MDAQKGRFEAWHDFASWNIAMRQDCHAIHGALRSESGHLQASSFQPDADPLTTRRTPTAPASHLSHFTTFDINLPPMKKYKQISLLSNGHSKGITAMKFNPLGTMLATGGLDGNICIWEVPTGRLIHNTVGQSPVASLQWVSRGGGEEIILLGSKDGNISVLTTSSVISLFDLSAMSYTHSLTL